jgi:hypothetical protein
MLVRGFALRRWLCAMAFRRQEKRARELSSNPCRICAAPFVPFFWRSGKEIRAGELGGQGRKPSSRTKIPSADTSQHLCGISNQEQWGQKKILAMAITEREIGRSNDESKTGGWAAANSCSKQDHPDPKQTVSKSKITTFHWRFEQNYNRSTEFIVIPPFFDLNKKRVFGSFLL